MKAQVQAIASELKTHGQIMFGLVGFMWVLEIINQFLFGNRLNYFGIVPRSIPGLMGIVFSPFLHVDFAHLIANTLPFLILGWWVLLRGIAMFLQVSIITMVVSGLGVWLFSAPNTVTVGASGLIFGYLGFLLLRGFFERSWLALFFSVIALIGYGSIIWGVLPIVPGVSWQGHLFGFIGGGLAARYIPIQGKSSPS
ncbi:rhomboid family intramembrane serine protease [Candidatus Synechococcus calcipolaris G9]|uniref:Rhomboid family intramembrane serine protease n=1 Tax=Candidatus Synechococcus calcipolaris G9 TaxID=1497997 RepID=A0ABT6F371_9SYNE|nr:rhomboid family intramembrane serine protease [Candidatus Synechococcus calcipolaris]MDG2992305.1 rhomboid family intramembrane serine protease [Candidatus Synechococcus calcipolaris G9]